MTDFPEILLEQLVKERIAEARAAAARRAVLASLHPSRQPFRLALGWTLIRIGQWVHGQIPENAGDLGRPAPSKESPTH